MWKTVVFNVGRDLQLDPPNSEATVRIVPLEWLPNRVQVELLAQISEADAAARAAAEREAYAESAAINLKMMSRVLPQLIKSWTLVDPDTGQPLPVDGDSLGSLPTSILTAIFSKAIGADEQRDESGIPLVNATPSEPSSSAPTPLPSSVSGL